MEEKNKSNNLISYFSNIEKTFLIANLTFLGYLIAYFYKASYLTFYNIPIQFTEVTLSDVIFSTVAVILIVFGLAIIIFIFRLLFKTNKNSQVKYVEPSFGGDILGSAIIFILLFFLILIVKVTIFTLTLKIIVLITIFLFIIIILFGLPFYNFPNEKSIKMKFEKYYEKRRTEQFQKFQKISQQEEKGVDLIGILFDPRYIGFSATIIAILVSVILAILIGNLAASTPNSFYVLNENNQSYFMADIYNNQIILMSFDEEKKITTGNILILPLSDIGKFTYKNTGQLNTYKNEQKQ
jgi:hypothetical protein